MSNVKGSTRICCKCKARRAGHGGYCNPCNTERARIYREQQALKSQVLDGLDGWMRAIVKPREPEPDQS